MTRAQNGSGSRASADLTRGCARPVTGICGALTSSERQWGTVREDYSDVGDAWNYLPHDHARSRAYRWGEDGLASFCDIEQRLCLALALWNGRDPILKERAFGLTGAEGNHGEDVKECWWFLDALPAMPGTAGATTTPSARSLTGNCSTKTDAVASSTPSMSCWIPESSTTIATGSSTCPTRRPTPPTS